MTSRRSRARRMRAAPSSSASAVTRPGAGLPTYAVGAAVAGAALAGAAFLNSRAARKAERDNPPIGRFVEVDGVRLHYLDEGEGEPLVLLHGNGSMVQDFVSSGLVGLASSRYRVIAFDRPGYGHSERPRSTVWTNAAQAELVAAALRKLGVPRATVLGHSWGCSVALALALNHPETVRGLVLLSGYYYPSVRVDVVALSGPAIPVVGDLIRYTASPILARLMWPLMMRKIFGPERAPVKFEGFPRAMTFRPGQIRAAAAEAALMIPDAIAFADRYGELDVPVVIVAGEEDRVVDIEDQSARLHADLPGSRLHRLAGAGHMVHQTRTRRVMDAIDEAADMAGQPRPNLRAVA